MASVFYRSLHSRFGVSGLRAAFAPRKPRHPLLRIALGLAGVVVLAVLLVVALLVGGAMLVFGLLGRRRAPAPVDARVVEGEYRVVPRAGQPLLR